MIANKTETVINMIIVIILMSGDPSDISADISADFSADQANQIPLKIIKC